MNEGRRDLVVLEKFSAYSIVELVLLLNTSSSILFTSFEILIVCSSS